jgi:hypothetical protein
MAEHREEAIQEARREPVDRVGQFFQAASYLQYPLLLIALGYSAAPYFQGFDTFWQSINQALVFAGLGISFSTLQDTRKTQNNFSRKIWQDPKKGKRALLLISLTTLGLLCFGFYGWLVAKPGIAREVAFGALMLGIGYMGLLKSAIEMREHHRQGAPLGEP